MGADGPELRIGLIGLGRVAERGYVPALALMRGVSLVAAAEPDPVRRESIRGRVPAFESARELLDAVDVDALVLATPAAFHVADATLASARGVPCLVEKPPAPELAGALALAALTPAPSVGFCRRFAPGLAAMRVVASRLDGYRLELSLETRGWMAYVADDGPLLDLGIHLADLARWLADDEPKRVRRLQEGEVAFEVELGRGTAVARCTHRRAYRESVALHRDDGRREAAWAEGGLARRVRARLARGAGGPLVPLLGAQLDAFARATRTGERDALATAQDGVEAMRVVEAVRASEGAAGAWVELAARAERD